MRHVSASLCLSALLGGSLLLTACQSQPYLPVSAYQNPLRAYSLTQRAPSDLVEAPGFKAGDAVSVRGPLFTQGQGKIHALNADAFKIEFSIANYHLIVSAERLNDKEARFVTIDVKANRTVEAVGKYVRTGNVTVFNMGTGSEVEKLTVKNQRNGYFETDVVQPGKLSLLAGSGNSRATVNLKFSKK